MNLPDFKRLISPIKNKIFLLLGRAILKAVESNTTDGGTVQKLQVIALAGETINDLERMQEYGLETYPHDGAEVFIGFLNGNRDHGVALVVHDDRHRPTDLAEGEVALYTDEDSSTDGHRIHLKRGQIVDIKCKEVDVDCDEISLGGTDFAALKTLIHSDFITLFNAHTHTHGDPAGTTSVPVIPAVELTHATIKVKGE